MILSNLIKVYGYGKIQDLLTLYTELEQNGYTMDDLTALVEARQIAMKRREKLRTPSPDCPECGKPINFDPVNTGAGDQTGDDSTFRWFCPYCEYERFTNESLRDIIFKTARKD